MEFNGIVAGLKAIGASLRGLCSTVDRALFWHLLATRDLTRRSVYCETRARLLNVAR